MPLDRRSPEDRERGPAADAWACPRCLARAWLVARLGGHLERHRGRVEELLELPDPDLLAAVGGAQRAALERELEGLDAEAVRRRAAEAGLQVVCRCHPSYPAGLLDLSAPPAVLHVAGGAERMRRLAAGDMVALVGSRKASAYGLEVARSLARGLGRAGITVVSGMAHGIDAAAHEGALAGSGSTVAVLPGSADRPYPASQRDLHRRIVAQGAAVSELPPGAATWRWTFPARNRLIAALATLTVVVEAGARSGALITARYATALERLVGAVPGRVTSPQAEGSNRLLAGGALVVRGPQDVLDHLFGAGARAAALDRRAPIERRQRALLNALADGADTASALARAGLSVEQGLSALAWLELTGYVRRGAGGQYSVVP